MEIKGANMDEELKKIISQRITETREKLGLTQLMLAEKAEITPAAMSQIENRLRIPSTPVLRKLAQALNVSVDYLLGRKSTTDLSDVSSDEKMASFFRNFNKLSSKDREFIERHVELMNSSKKK